MATSMADQTAEVDHEAAHREAMRTIDEYPKLIQPSKTDYNLARAYLARCAEVDALVALVMRGSHREARDFARPHFIAMNPDERSHASKVQTDAMRAEASEARCAALVKALRDFALTNIRGPHMDTRQWHACRICSGEWVSGAEEVHTSDCLAALKERT